MAQSIKERYAALTYEQKVLFSAMVRKELADAALSVVRRLRRVVDESKNDAAAVAAGKELNRLSEKYGVLKTDSIEEFGAELQLALRQQNGSAHAEFERELPLSS
jgi:hypothetical protein